MAGRIPQNFIDELVARIDIVEVVGARVALRKAGREYKGLCPFHGEKTASFTVSPDKGFYHCFGCGAHGTALGFMMEHDHLSFVEAVESLAAALGLEVPHESGPARDRGVDRAAELMRRAAELYSSALKTHAPAIDYLKGRGIDGDTAARFGLGYAPDAWDTVMKAFGDDRETQSYLQAAGLVIRRDDGRQYDRFRDRIMFPIRDSRGRPIAFGGRLLGPGEPKYLNSPETVLFSKRRELYGLYEARRRLRDIPRLVVVEGYMDVVALARHGVEYAVATLGTATTPEHLRQLFRICDEVLFCFDGDRAGRQAAWRALETTLPELRDGRQIGFVFLPDGEDPDSLVSRDGAGAFEAELDGATALSEFLVGELAGQSDASTVDGRARLAEAARPLLARVPDGVYRELLLERLGAEVGLGAARLDALFANDRRETRHKAPQQRMARPLQRELSLVARALRALLHQPQLGELADVEALAGLTRKGSDLLVEVLEITQSDPHLTSAQLLERLRHHRHIAHLETLLGADYVEHDGQAARAEFEGAVSQLELAALKEQARELVRRQAEIGLDAEQRQELLRLQKRLAQRSGAER